MTGKLSERAMLVSLHIGTWTGMMHDQEITEEISETYNADKKEAGRYNKRLVATKFFKEVSAAHTKARKLHKILTLPWDDDGTRILTTKGYMNYTSTMKEARLKTEAAAKGFIGMRDDFITEARVRLVDMFDEADYPSLDELKAKFSFDVEVKSLPESGDFRAKLSDDVVKGIVKDIENRSNKRLESAMNDVFERILGVVTNMLTKLKEYQPKSDAGRAKGIIRDTVITHIFELAEALPALNIMDDPRVDELRKQLMGELVDPASPEILRTDAKARAQAIKNAAAIMKKVKGYMT